jgi:hypothetical protein
MKSAVSTENGQQSHSYCIWWRRAGAQDRFRHWVLAGSIDEAVRRSRLDVTKALGSNAGLWKIEESEKQITAAIATEVVSWGPGRSSQRVGIMAFVVLLLGLLFLFHFKSVAPAEPMESDRASGIGIPETPSENNPAWRALLERITK